MQELFNFLVLVIEFVGVGTVITIFKSVVKMRGEQKQELNLIKEGQKCQLRSDMLVIYYKSVEHGTIRQYELENFITLYKAYKALDGNSFIDKIYGEVMKLTVTT